MLLLCATKEFETSFDKTKPGCFPGNIICGSDPVHNKLGKSRFLYPINYSLPGFQLIVDNANSAVRVADTGGWRLNFYIDIFLNT